MPRPVQRPGRPANRPGQTRGGRRGQKEAFERRGDALGSASAQPAAVVGPAELPHVLTVGELAKLLNVNAIQVIKALFDNGIMATINQSLDYDTAAIVAGDLGFEVKEQSSQTVATGNSVLVPDQAAVAAAAAAAAEAPDDESLLAPRPPVV